MSKYARITLIMVVKEAEADQILEEVLQAEDLIKADHHIYWDNLSNESISRLPKGSEPDIDDEEESTD